MMFAARQFDSETGLYYVRVRYYDPQLGRFISEDPIGLLGGINPYVYAGNDPVNQLDPSGQCGPLCIAVAGGAIAGRFAWRLLLLHWYGEQSERALPDRSVFRRSRLWRVHRRGGRIRFIRRG